MPILWNCRVDVLKVCICWDNTTFQGEDGFDEGCNSRVAFSMSNVTFEGSDNKRILF